MKVGLSERWFLNVIRKLFSDANYCLKNVCMTTITCMKKQKKKEKMY